MSQRCDYGKLDQVLAIPPFTGTLISLSSETLSPVKQIHTNKLHPGYGKKKKTPNTKFMNYLAFI